MSEVSNCSEATVIRVKKINDKKESKLRPPNDRHDEKQSKSSSGDRNLVNMEKLREKQRLLRALQKKQMEKQKLLLKLKLNESYYSDDFEFEQSRQRLNQQHQCISEAGVYAEAFLSTNSHVDSSESLNIPRKGVNYKTNCARKEQHSSKKRKDLNSIKEFLFIFL